METLISKARKFAPIILITIIFILNIVSAATPWYNSGGYRISSINCVVFSSMGWFTASVQCSGDCGIFSATCGTSTNWRGDNCENSIVCKLRNIFDSALAMIILSLITSFILLMTLILYELIPFKLPQFVKTKIFRIILSISNVIFLVVAIITFSAGLPAAVKDDCPETAPFCTFIGEKQDVLGTMFWGPLAGWIIAVINSFLSLCLFVAILKLDYGDSYIPIPN